MKSFLKRKITRLLLFVFAAIVGCACTVSSLTYFNVDTAGKSLNYKSQEGASENLEAIAPAYDGSGFFVSSYYDLDNERKSLVKKVGKDNAVEFESELVHATKDGVTDQGIFSYITGVSENKVIAFTSNWYYLYELGENGLTFLDAYQGHLNIGAGMGIRNFAFDVYGDVIDIYSIDNKGANSATLTVYIEKTTVNGNAFTGSVYNEIKKASGKRLTNMGAQSKGLAVTEDHKNVIVAFTSARALMFSSDLSGLAAADVEEYNRNVQTIMVGSGVDGDTVTAAQYDGNNALYVFMQNRNVYRLTSEDFLRYGDEDYSPDLVTTIGEYGSFCSYDLKSGTLFTVNENGNTLYAIDTEKNKLDYTVSLKFKIKDMVASDTADTFVCQWQDSVTDKIEYVVYNYEGLSRFDAAKVGKNLLLSVGIIGCALAVFMIFAVIFDGFSAKAADKIKWFFRNVWKSKWVYLIILPSFILLFLFSIYPSVAAVINSFFEYELGKPKIFVGFANYKELIVTNSGLFLEIARNTVLFVLMYLFTMVVPPVFYAYLIMLLRNKKSVNVVRWFMYIPGLLPTIAAMLMWRYGIYGINPDGALNIIIRELGGTPVPFLGNSDYAIWSILLIGFPWVGGFLLFYGALLTVPTEVYDACELEGCGLVRRFFVIDLPFIMGQVKYVSIGAVIAGVKAVGRIMATTGGQMGTMTLMYKLYEYLNKNRYGMASTIAVIMVVLLAGISIARVRKMLKRENSYD